MLPEWVLSMRHRAAEGWPCIGSAGTACRVLFPASPARAAPAARLQPHVEISGTARLCSPQHERPGDVSTAHLQPHVLPGDVDVWVRQVPGVLHLVLEAEEAPQPPARRETTASAASRVYKWHPLKACMAVRSRLRRKGAGDAEGGEGGVDALGIEGPGSLLAPGRQNGTGVRGQHVVND